MQSIILIGPMRAGKSTVAQHLGEKFNMTPIHFDRVRSTYYPEFGYDDDVAKQKFKDGGHSAWYAYQKQFELALVEKLVSEHPENHVLDFGAGHSVYTDEAQFERVKSALKIFEHVILLQPCEDTEQAIQILNQRDLDAGESGLPELNRHFVEHPANRTLATHIINNATQTLQETLAKISEIVKK